MNQASGIAPVISTPASVVAASRDSAPLAVRLPMRSKLFVPGCRPELFGKAAASAADAVSFDFEDSVPEPQKPQARAEVRRYLEREAAGLSHNKVVIVRTNAMESAHFKADLAAAVIAGVHYINIPKVESADAMHQAAAMLAELERQCGLTAGIGLLANIESPRGVRLAHEIAAANERVVGLQIGYGDLFEPLRISRRDQAAIHHVQMVVRLAAGEAGIAAYDAAFADIADIPAYFEEARRASLLGYAGKTCIHPSQIAAANQAFGSDAAEIAFSRKVVQAWQAALAEGRGAITVDGQMIDAPFALKAQRVLERAGIEEGLP